jgi:hypothetical protein
MWLRNAVGAVVAIAFVCAIVALWPLWWFPVIALCFALCAVGVKAWNGTRRAGAIATTIMFGLAMWGALASHNHWYGISANNNSTSAYTAVPDKATVAPPATPSASPSPSASASASPSPMAALSVSASASATPTASATPSESTMGCFIPSPIMLGQQAGATCHGVKSANANVVTLVSSKPSVAVVSSITTSHVDEHGNPCTSCFMFNVQGLGPGLADILLSIDGKEVKIGTIFVESDPAFNN